MRDNKSICRQRRRPNVPGGQTAAAKRPCSPNPPSYMPCQKPEDDELLVHISEPADVTRRQVTSQPVTAEPGQREDPERPRSDMKTEGCVGQSDFATGSNA
uniref:Uncharacterized protein n=1 Tax=Trichuris muris TaxID=70415 RepID=A0A5S6Q3G0_TRIMR